MSENHDTKNQNRDTDNENRDIETEERDINDKNYDTKNRTSNKKPRLIVDLHVKITEDQYAKKPADLTNSKWVRYLIDSHNSLKNAFRQNTLLKKAFKQLYLLFDKFTQDPTEENAFKLLSSMDLSLIDEARGIS